MITLLKSDVLEADWNSLQPINLVVTSPPYNVGIEYDTHRDTMTYPEYLKWCHEWLKKIYHALAPDGRVCINIPFSVTPEHINTKKGAEDINYPVVADYTRICESIGFKYWRTLVWDKNHSNKTCWGSWRSASAPFMRDPSEAILVFYKTQWKRLNKGTSTISGPEFMSWTKNVWKMHPETKSTHPAAFPIELPNRCIKLFSYKEDTVLDLFMGCYDKDTEVLTYDGWKRFEFLNKTDRILTRTPEGAMEYQRPSKYYAYHFNGEMIKVKSRSTDLLVTPNHNMYVLTHDDFCRGHNPRFLPANQLYQQCYRIPIGGTYLPSNDTIPKEIMYLIGLYVSEGYFANWRKKKKLTICQNKGEKWDQMVEWVRDLNPRQHGPRKFVVDLDSRWINFIIENCGEGKYNKYLSPVILNNKYLECLFDAMMLGDGCTSKSNKGYWSKSYFTSSPKLAVSFEELCLKLGYATSTSTRMRDGHMKLGHFVKQTCPAYHVRVRRSNNQMILPKKHITNQHYCGEVYCVEVPNHTLYVKRNGYCSWCGNSGTTGESAVRLERNFVGIEKSDAYFDGAKARVEEAELQTALAKQIMPLAPVDYKADAAEAF